MADKNETDNKQQKIVNLPPVLAFMIEMTHIDITEKKSNSRHVVFSSFHQTKAYASKYFHKPITTLINGNV